MILVVLLPEDWQTWTTISRSCSSRLASPTSTTPGMHVRDRSARIFQLIFVKGSSAQVSTQSEYRCQHSDGQGTGSDGSRDRNMKLDSKTASFYYSRPSEWLGGRRAVVPCAHILGGGSSINFMVRFSTPL